MLVTHTYARDCQGWQVCVVIRLPAVSPSFHVYTRACRYPQCHQVSTFTCVHAVIFSAFSTHYPQSTRRAVIICRAPRSCVRDVTRTHAGVRDITLWGMPRGAESHFLRSIMEALATDVEKVECCGSIRILRSHPDHRGDVCKVWFRSVQKCGFV